MSRMMDAEVSDDVTLNVVGANALEDYLFVIQ